MKRIIKLITGAAIIALIYFIIFYSIGLITSIELKNTTITNHFNEVIQGKQNMSDYINNKQELKQLAKTPIEAIKKAFEIDKKILYIITAVVTAIIIYKLIYIAIFKQQILNYLGFKKRIEDKKGTYGSARWADEKDIHKLKREKTLGTQKGIIIGSITKPKNTNKKINLKNRLTISPEAKMMNGHAIVVSGSGGGKTYSFVLPNGVNAVKENANVLFIDPKGEIFKTLSKYYQKNGYKVRALNLVKPEFSDRFNPLDLIKTDLDALLFTQVILNNTNIDLDMKKSGDPFWEKGETNLLKALVLYIKSKYKKEQQNMALLYDLVLDADVKKLDKLFQKISDDTAMKKAYKVYAQGEERVRAGIIMGLGSRLQIFQHKDIRKMTEANDIDIYDLKKEKAAFFLIIPDTHSSYDYIAGIFMNFLLIKLPELHDFTEDENIKNKKLRIIGDEIANVGKIANLTKVITTLRSRNIDFYPIYQNLGQIKEAFGQTWETITGNCDTFVYMGGNDEETSEYISKKLGEQTIKVINKTKTDGLSNLTDTKRWAISEQKRRLMTRNEVEKLDKYKCIVFVRGENPLLLYKYGFNALEEYKEIKEMEINITDYIPVRKRKLKTTNKEYILIPNQNSNKNKKNTHTTQEKIDDIVNEII